MMFYVLTVSPCLYGASEEPGWYSEKMLIAREMTGRRPRNVLQSEQSHVFDLDTQRTETRRLERTAANVPRDLDECLRT